MGIIFATVRVQTHHAVSVQCHASSGDISKGHFLTASLTSPGWFVLFCFVAFFFFFFKSESTEGGRRHKKMRPDPNTYSEVKPRREWRNQGLIWSECPQAPKPSGSPRVMGSLRQSYITFHLYQINWLAFYGQLLPCTQFDTLMDNGETLPPYGNKKTA